MTARSLLESVNSGDTLTQEELFPLFSRASLLVNDCVRLLLRENDHIQLCVIALGAEVAANLDRNKAIYRRSVAFVDDEVRDIPVDQEQRESDFLCSCLDLQAALVRGDRESQIDIVLSLPLTRMVFEQFVKDWLSHTGNYPQSALLSLQAHLQEDPLITSRADAECHTVEQSCHLDPHTAYGVVRYIERRVAALHDIYDRMFNAYSRVILKQAKAQAVSEDHSLDCLAGDTLVWTDRGFIRMDEFKASKVQTTHGLKEACPHFPEEKIRNTVKLTTRLGLSVTGTPDHKVRVLDPEKQELVWVSMQDAVGHYVPVATGSDLTWPLDPQFSFEGTSYGRKRSAVLPDRLTTDLASLMGYLVSEGTVYAEDSSNRGLISFSNSNPGLLSHYTILASSVFDLKVSDHKKKETDVHELLIRDHAANEFLRYAGCLSLYSGYKVVPWSVLQGSKESVISFLRAYWEGDGSLVDRPSCGSKSERLILEIQQLLLRLGIVSKRTTQKRKTDYYGNPTEEELVMHILTVTSGEDAQKFLDVVGYTSTASAEEAAKWGRRPTQRQRALKLTDVQVKEILHRVDHGESYALLGPQYGVTPEYISQISRGRDKYKGQKYVPTTGYVVSRCKRNLVPGVQARKTSSKTNRHAYFCDLPADSTLKALEGRYIFDLVESVEPAGERPVFDISVEDVHEFTSVGMVLSNCFQNGSFGLLRAISSYDNVSNARFVGHARWWIRQSMLYYLKEDSNLIRVSSNTWQHYAKLESIRSKQESKLGPLSTDELSAASGYSTSHVDTIYSTVRTSQVRSLDYPLKSDGSSTTMSLVDASEEQDPLGFDPSDSVKVLLESLPENLRNLVCLSFGLTEYVYQKLDPSKVALERSRQISAKT